MQRVQGEVRLGARLAQAPRRGHGAEHLKTAFRKAFHGF